MRAAFTVIDNRAPAMRDEKCVRLSARSARSLLEMPSVLQTASPNFREVLAVVYTILAEREFRVVGRVVSAMSFSKTYKHGGRVGSTRPRRRHIRREAKRERRVQSGHCLWNLI